MSLLFWSKRAPRRSRPPAISQGFRVQASDTSVRPLFTAADMRSFLPSRGRFQFPEPYGTTGIRLTNQDDGEIEPVGYSYWRRINNHAGQPSLFVVMGRTNASALLVAVDKTTYAVTAGPLDDLVGTGEQWYFSAREPFMLYVTEGRQLVRYNVATHERQTVFEVDEAHYLWQCHSSHDGQVHSATLRRASGEIEASVVYRVGVGIELFPPRQPLDECQIDASGRYLVIKEGEDNRIIDLETKAETVISNADGALGHSDNGFGYAVGEDDHHAQPGAFVWVNLANPSDRRLISHTTDWEPMSRHVAHGNAPQGRVLLSSACRVNVPRSNEFVLAPLDGSLQLHVVAPNLIDLDAPGGGDDYRKQAHANIDTTGTFACWSANCGTDRLDAFLLALPT